MTVAELDAAVEERLDDRAVAAFAEAEEAEFTRRVLGLLVQEEVYAVAAERFGVEVADDEVRARIDELLGDDDPEHRLRPARRAGHRPRGRLRERPAAARPPRIAAAEGQAEAPSTTRPCRPGTSEVRETLARGLRSATSPCPTRRRPTPCWPRSTADPAELPRRRRAVPRRVHAGRARVPRRRRASPAVLAEGIAAAAAQHRLHHAGPGGRRHRRHLRRGHGLPAVRGGAPAAGAGGRRGRRRRPAPR